MLEDTKNNIRPQETQEKQTRFPFPYLDRFMLGVFFEPKAPQDASKTPQDAPRRPKTRPRRPKALPRRPMTPPRRPKLPPRCPQDAPGFGK